jgi:hypothetical protein
MGRNGSILSPRSSTKGKNVFHPLEHVFRGRMTKNGGQIRICRKILDFEKKIPVKIVDFSLQNTE